jgi:hypothetical protein
MLRCAQQCAQLPLEDVGVRKPEADAAQTPVTGGAFLRREPASVERRIDERTRNLPLVHVERTDRDRPAPHPFDQLSVDLILLVLVHEVRRRTRDHELRSVEADAFGTRRDGRGHVGPPPPGVSRQADRSPLHPSRRPR